MIWHFKLFLFCVIVQEYISIYIHVFIYIYI